MTFASHTKVSKDFNGARHFLRVSYAKYAKQLAPSLSIQDVGDTQQVFRWPKMNVNLFRRLGVGMSEARADELDGNAFYVQCRGEIMTQRMRPELRYPGLPGKFFTEAVQAVS